MKRPALVYGPRGEPRPEPSLGEIGAQGKRYPPTRQCLWAIRPGLCPALEATPRDQRAPACRRPSLQAPDRLQEGLVRAVRPVKTGHLTLRYLSCG
jgi:hypothetical protein